MRWIVVLSFLFLLVSVLPGARAEEPEIYMPEVTETFPDEGMDNEALMEGYVQRLFAKPTRIKLRGARNVGNDLPTAGKMVYNGLKGPIQEVAAGTRTSTVFTVSLDWSWAEKTEFTAADLGVDAIVVNNTVSTNALNAAEAQIGFNSANVIRALMADYPYDMYWYDKTTGCRRSYPFECVRDSGTREYILRLKNIMTYYFAVATEYAGSEDYTLDPALTLTAQRAAATASGIVQRYASRSDYDKLHAYRWEICNLVDYNHAAAGGGWDYGNPWQLVWVFDGDPETKVVCEGYSKAFQYLCDMSTFQSSNVMCYSVSGLMNNGRHMWNIVTMPDGHNYLADVTNCDAGSVGADTLLFLKGYQTYDDAQGVYIFSIKRGSSTNTVTYKYQDETLQLYPADSLVISGDDYDAPTGAHPFGSVGLSANWNLTADGVITVSGRGTLASPDWEDYAAEVTTLIIGDQITGVSANVLNTLPGLETVIFAGNAPSFASGAFQDVTATVWYPHGQPDWTADVRQSYGGTVSWQQYCSYGDAGVVASAPQYAPGVPATCEEAGTPDCWICTACGRQFDEEALLTSFSGGAGEPALGHVWGEAEYVWAEDNSAVTATRVCDHNAEHVQTETVPATGEVTLQPTCTEMGETTYTSDPFQNEAFAVQSKTVADVPAAGHTEVIDPAVEPTDTESGLTEGKHCSVCGFVIVPQEVIPPTGPAIVDSGTCGANGDNLTWTLDENGLLTISGTGAMTDYDSWENFAPWNEKNVVTIQIDDGVTHIGNFAFNWCSSLTDVTIPAGVTSIGENAFSSTGLTGVTIPAGVTGIGDGAFGGCRSLTGISVANGNTAYSSADGVLYNAAQTVLLQWPAGKAGASIPSGVTRIGSSAFFRCVNVTSVTIPAGVTSIGDGAFSNCENLTSIELPSGLTSIGDYAFMTCTSLTGVTIPSTVTSIGDYAFCETAMTSIVIPEGVARLGYGALSLNENLTSVTFPSTLTRIEGDTFLDSSNLTDVTIPEGVISIGESAFVACSKLTVIELPSGMTSLGFGAFSNCTGMTAVTIPKSMTSIDEAAFNQCTSLADVYYGGTEAEWNAISIGESNDPLLNATIHFAGPAIVDSGTCGANLTWTLDENGLLTISGTGAMNDYFAFSNESPWYPKRTMVQSVVLNENVTTIGKFAFRECSNLTSITIPNGVTGISGFAFDYCRSLANVAIPQSVTVIGDYAFRNCESLLSIDVSGENTAYASMDGVLFNKNRTLLICCPAQAKTGIYSVPATVTGIAGLAFANCSGLTSIMIPASVIEISDSAFNNCSSLTDFTVSGENTAYASHEGVLFNKTFSELICCPVQKTGLYLIPEGVTHICENAFNQCGSLTSVQIPTGVITIGDYAFANCGSLESITIPEGVKEIGYRSFYFSRNLASITIPDSVTSIGVWAFNGCYATIYAHVGTDGGKALGEADYTFIDPSLGCEFKYLYENNTVSGLELRKVNQNTANVILPADLTRIASGAFSQCTNLRNLFFLGSEEEWLAVTGRNYVSSSVSVYYNYTPGMIIASGTCGANVTWTLNDSGLLTISGTGAMACYTISDPSPWSSKRDFIQRVVIESGVTSIGDWAFQGCVGITEMIIPEGVTSIGLLAFENCNQLNSVQLPSSLISIGECAFNYCRSLTDITIPSDVTNIGREAFSVCINLRSVTIPAGVTSIENYAFSWCSSLTSVTIPEGVTRIGNGAFEGCDSLPSIAIPEGVTSIGVLAFNSCSSLTSVTIPFSVTSIDESAFENCDNVTLYVEAGSTAYQYAIDNGISYVIVECRHIWGETEYVWAEDNSAVTATRVCTKNAQHVETETVNAVKRIVSPTQENAGAVVYTAEFTNEAFETQEKSTAIPALGTLFVLRLPSGLETIEDEAFMNLACEAVIIPDSCTSIGQKAFADCTHLVYVYIPAGVSTIETDAFDNCPNAVIDRAGE